MLSTEAAALGVRVFLANPRRVNKRTLSERAMRGRLRGRLKTCRTADPRRTTADQAFFRASCLNESERWSGGRARGMPFLRAVWHKDSRHHKLLRTAGVYKRQFGYSLSSPQLQDSI